MVKSKRFPKLESAVAEEYRFVSMLRYMMFRKVHANMVRRWPQIHIRRGRNENMDDIWLYCPGCKRKSRIKVYENTTLIHFPLYCHWCRKEYIISFVDKKMMMEKEKEISG